jgi:phosphonopyruvate decarboxylase
MQIPWELFPTDPAAIAPALDRAIAHMDASGRPYALLMQKGSVAAHALAPGAGLAGTHAPGASATISSPPPPPPPPPQQQQRTGDADRPSRQQALQVVVAHTPGDSTAVLASTGYCGRELYAIEDRPNQLYMVGSMGCVTALALGLALARPQLRVVALDGDGAALMRMGTFATVGAYGPPNLLHLLLDNHAHDSTGGQATVSAHVSFGQVAAACGYAHALEAGELAQIAEWLEAPPLAGARFASLRIRTGTPRDLPRPALTPTDVRQRLMRHIGAAGDRH